MNRLAAIACALACGLAAPAFGQSAPATPTPVAPPAPPPPACAAPEHRQFDFWVGRWDVYPTGTQRLVAHSLIERLYRDCGIRENWMPLRGWGGGSLNSYRPAERRWRQLWMDSQNSWLEFSGGMEGEAMVLTAPSTGANGAPALVRMTYTHAADGSVRQQVTQSTDNGTTWQPQYDFTYVRAAG
ncbi:MAG TPA: hypothetical protein VIT38_14565 [Allosphingosinicella sp.]|jgi:hypothetical protein